MYRATLVVLAAVCVAAAPFRAPGAHAASGAPCPQGYAYAGIIGWQQTRGVAATISVAAAPAVAAGHVAGWVGEGGKHLGPRGADEWIQAGLSGFRDQPSEVYAEIETPGSAPAYTEVAAAKPGERYRIAVVRLPGERWEVRVDGRVVAGPVHLPGSAAWRAVATAESWLPASSPCNEFTYRFDNVDTLGAGSAAWKPLKDVAVVAGQKYRVARSGASFVATTH